MSIIACRILIVLSLLLSAMVLIGKKGYAQTQPTTLVKDDNKSGFMMLLGPSVYYYQGSPQDNFQSFSTKSVSYQAHVFIGYTTAKKQGGNALGIFGTAGYTSENIFNSMLSFQNLSTDEIRINKYFTFYQVEAGVIIANVLRFGTGIGKQEFTTVSGEGEFNYLSSTAGLMINLGPVMWNIDANFNYGRDLPNTSVKIGTGLLVKF
ncbi:MAG: hypothetical protein KF856_12685 [Cyclobacteriaceae bacterium]|nr:hypothetical protein [Cyclobacteriaceae bacterium]